MRSLSPSPTLNAASHETTLIGKGGQVQVLGDIGMAVASGVEAGESLEAIRVGSLVVQVHAVLGATSRV